MDRTEVSSVVDGPASRILRVADELFYQKGYGATGINELIAEAGVARASFYQHFPSKLDLIVAYLQNRHTAWIGGLAETVSHYDSPDRRLLAVFDFLTEWLQTNNFRGCAFLNTVPEFSDPESIPRQVVREHKRELQDYLSRLCAEAAYPDASETVLLLVEGAMAQAAVVRTLWPVTAARDFVQQRLDGQCPTSHLIKE